MNSRSDPTRVRCLVKGNHAIALGAIAGGMDAFFGYPITPQNEVPEMLAELMPRLGRTFIQAESEIASINMVYGAAGAGLRTMTSSSSPGISLMLEGVSYLAGAMLPCFIVNVMRGGPGLGNIAPAQGDYFQAVKGGGHGDYRCLVLAPWSVQEMFDLPCMAFEMAERYRMPTMMLTDAVLGSMLEPADIIDPDHPDFGRRAPREAPEWASAGRFGRKQKNVINSIYLEPQALLEHNESLARTYARAQCEMRYDGRLLDDAEFVVVAYGISARIAFSAVKAARAKGLKVGLLRPITLWPFPTQPLAELAERVGGMMVFELSGGQMVEDVRLAVESRCPVTFFGKMGGVLPTPAELVEQIEALMPEACHV